jgi:mono/diheme cytochrome c family protein
MQLPREIHLTKMGALAALGAITIGIQSPAPLNAQAPDNAGKTAYSQNCASCHGANIDDGELDDALR